MTDIAHDPQAAPVASDSAARSLRLRTILVIGAVAGLTLISTTQTWWTVVAQGKSLTVVGTVAAPALSALSLCGLALAAALAIAGPFFRFILGVLQVLLGFTATLTTILTLAGPDAASESVVSKATGISGSASVRQLIASVHQTPWGYIAAILGAASVVIGVFLLATFRRWPAASRKYSAVRFEDADGAADEDGDPGGVDTGGASRHHDAVVDWDALSEGEDPTAGRTP